MRGERASLIMGEQAGEAGNALVRFSTDDADVNRELLEAAGYVLDGTLHAWWHGDLERALDADVARVLRSEHVRAWIADGVAR